MEAITTRIILSAVAACAVVLFLWYFVTIVGDNASKGVKIGQLEGSLSKLNNAAIEKVENERMFQSMDAAQLDALGRSHGWMRSDVDR